MPTTDALFVHGETVESRSLLGEGLGHVESVGDLIVVAGEGKVGSFGDVDGEKIFFDGASAGETPVGFGDTTGQQCFMLADRGEASHDRLHKGFGGDAFGVRQETDLAGEAVTEGVEAGALLAFLSFWAGGLPGVAAVGFQTIGRDAGSGDGRWG